MSAFAVSETGEGWENLVRASLLMPRVGAEEAEVRNVSLGRDRAGVQRPPQPHFAHGHTDDDEGTYIEYFIFDDVFLDEPDVLDRLPHPDRAPFKSSGEGHYQQLIDRLLAR
jgi:hypothetical protein